MKTTKRQIIESLIAEAFTNEDGSKIITPDTFDNVGLYISCLDGPTPDWKYVMRIARLLGYRMSAGIAVYLHPIKTAALILVLLVLPLLAYGQELQYWKHFKDTPKQQEPVAPVIKPPSRYDWSFTKDPKFYACVGFSFGVTAYDIFTSHGPEHTRLLRGSNGELNRAKYYGITAITNAGFLPLDLMANHKWRWVSFGGRVGLALWRFRGGLHNGGRR